MTLQEKDIKMNTLKLIRPKQWIKNLFVFLPVFFSGNLLHGATFLQAAITLVAFCFVASSIYCLNDIIDVEAMVQPGTCLCGRSQP